MSGNRMLSMLWFIVATAYALRALVALAARRNASEEVVQMLLALALMKFYEEDK